MPLTYDPSVRQRLIVLFFLNKAMSFPLMRSLAFAPLRVARIPPRARIPSRA